MNTLPTLCAIFLLPAADASTVDYTRQIKPLLAKHCFECHGPSKQRGGLRLDSGKAILKGGNSGVVVIPGKCADSLLVKAITSAEGVKQMPPKGDRLKADEIALLRAWIEGGAKHPSDESTTIVQTKSKHWSFQPT